MQHSVSDGRGCEKLIRRNNRFFVKMGKERVRERASQLVVKGTKVQEDQKEIALPYKAVSINF